MIILTFWVNLLHLRQSQSVRKKMRVSTYLPFLLYLLPTCHLTDVEKYSKVVCSLSKFKEVELLAGTFRDSIKLSKKLFQECNIKLRMVTPDTHGLWQKDMKIFANHKRPLKETLSPLLQKDLVHFLKLHWVPCNINIIHLNNDIFYLV